MYIESEESKSLMRLNKYYIERDLCKSLSLWKKIKRTGGIIKELIYLPAYGLSDTLLKIHARINPKYIVDYSLEYTDAGSYEINYNATNKRYEGKIAVYTSIFGNYDSLISPMYRSPYCDYFAITDQDIPIDSPWRKYETGHLSGFEKLDDYHKSKFCKVFPHILFPDYKYSIWVDGNITIVSDLYPLLDRLEEDKCIGMFNNPSHDCIYTEERFIVYYNYARKKEIHEQIKSYKESGFPEHFGMRECSIIVRKHSDDTCISLMNEWWENLNTYTMRDQISLPYVLWKNGYNIDFIQLLGDTWRWNPRFIQNNHLKHITYNK